MDKVRCTVGSITIPTYREPPAEELPMFAENRVHQRTSGRPYPNKVVMQVDRTHKEDKEYKLVTLENEYVKIEILPEIGGRIYSALDKTTGYDFFYKQHVIKPALIGVLGSWISGGVEFNWPFHHRASGFMPCDFTVEQLPDGGVACRLSEHDPIDRMKGMVSVILRPGKTYFETAMRLYNRTPAERSFLWWENAAVPVNEQYQIFFPQDVSYVNFHYLKSRTTYPIAGNGVYNGIPMEEERDISWHKNTRQATSYFAAASEYDFFGGYDHGKKCGVIHIGDHHISPGKKMFTWAYCQLAKSWENALTDTDGAYAELMAGSYSDNQPDFSWLAPYETKEFSQYWYPIAKIGAPTFANLHCAFRLDREKDSFCLQTTEAHKNLTVRITSGSDLLFEKTGALAPTDIWAEEIRELPRFVTVTVTADGKKIAEYAEKDFNRFNMPPTISDMPSAADMKDADELFLAGVHVDQYRDPHTEPDSYWKEALKRKPDHIPSLIAMAKYELGGYRLKSAEQYIKRAVKAITLYNERVQSGDVYYTYGRILEALGDTDKAYDMYYNAAWAADSVAKAMTRIAVIDIRREAYDEAVRHAQTALSYGSKNNLALACLVIALREQGDAKKADAVIKEQLKSDPLDHTMRFLAGQEDLYALMDSDAVQTCLDIAFDLSAMGRYRDIMTLLSGLENARPDCRRKPLYYALGFYADRMGQDRAAYDRAAASSPLGACYPSRYEEIAVLESAIEGGDDTAKMLLGCLYYSKRQYEKAASLWEECEDDMIARRNLAVAYFSHLGRQAEALSIMRQLSEEYREDQQLLYETVVLLGKIGADPQEKIDLIKQAPLVTRDDILTELAKAYNQSAQPEKAIETLLSHDFVPCEGGEHAIADQYMFAHLYIGRRLMAEGAYEKALDVLREGQCLPQSLGAGIWNHCKLIPLKYLEAETLTALGKADEAEPIFRYIAGVEIEYFSNMHLKELPYFRAKAWQRLGENVKGRQLITKYRREWEEIINTVDNGFLGTTPFFISFTDDPKRLRSAQYRYLMSLCCDLEGKADAARQHLKDSLFANGENLLALSFFNQGFLR